MPEVIGPIVSLFSGAGGLDTGFCQAGFATAFACDYCPAAVRSFNTNHHGSPAQHIDLVTEPSDSLVNRISVSLRGNRPVGVLAGPPCQGFSRGNVHRNPSDPRNLLPLKFSDHLAAIIDAFDIDFFVFENVLGLAGPKHAELLGRVRAALGATGFTLYEGVLNALDFGVPQRRKRMFLVGLNPARHTVSFRFPVGRSKARTVRDAIAGLPEPAYNRLGITPEEIRFHRNHWTSSCRSAKLITGHATDGRSFRRLDWDEPSPTVAYGNREISVHPDGGRRLSVYEAMLLQGFPKRYRLFGNFSQQVAQVCNAVPPPLAKAIANRIAATTQHAVLG
jgi:DNA (cytosine-5)-methyltransferase 1